MFYRKKKYLRDVIHSFIILVLSGFCLFLVQGATAAIEKDVRKINYFVNRSVVQINDLEHFGVLDYWQHPIETILNGVGDCEDIAALKVYLIESLEHPFVKAELLFLEQETNAIGENAHVVVLVNERFVLDNLTNVIILRKDLKVEEILTLSLTQYLTHKRYLKTKGNSPFFVD